MSTVPDPSTCDLTRVREYTSDEMTRIASEYGDKHPLTDPESAMEVFIRDWCRYLGRSFGEIPKAVESIRRLGIHVDEQQLRSTLTEGVLIDCVTTIVGQVLSSAHRELLVGMLNHNTHPADIQYAVGTQREVLSLVTPPAQGEDS